MKNYIQPNIFQYYPSDIYGNYEFFYEDYKKRRYWFFYNTFPYYGKYWFDYDIRDILIVDKPTIRLSKSNSSKELDIRRLYNPTLPNNREDIIKLTLDFYRLREIEREKIVVEKVGKYGVVEQKNILSIAEYILLKRDETSEIVISNKEKTLYRISQNSNLLNILEDKIILEGIEYLVANIIDQEVLLREDIKKANIKKDLGAGAYISAKEAKVQHTGFIEHEIKNEVNNSFVIFNGYFKAHKNNKDSSINIEKIKTIKKPKKIMIGQPLIKYEELRVFFGKLEVLDDFKVSKYEKNILRENLIYYSKKMPKEIKKIEDIEEGLRKKPKKINVDINYIKSQKKPKNIYIEAISEIGTKKKPKRIDIENLTIFGVKHWKKIRSYNGEVSLKRGYEEISKHPNEKLLEKDKEDMSIYETIDLKDNVGDLEISDSTIATDKLERDIEIDRDISAKKDRHSLEVEDTLLGVDNIERRAHIPKEQNGYIKDYKDVKVEVEKRLELHSRFWFLDKSGEVDWKILPNKDTYYPPNIDIMIDKPNGTYVYEYSTRYSELNSLYVWEKPYIIELYNKDYKTLDTLTLDEIEGGKYRSSYIALEVEVLEDIDVKDELGRYNTFLINYKILIKKDIDVAYIIIREPLNQYDNHVIFATTPKFIENKHPIPIGDELGLREIPIDIAIMVDFINILFLMWYRFYFQFMGYTGTMAIYGIINTTHEWLTLNISKEQETIEDYNRCYRWLRWEAEKIYNKAKLDPDLHGNYWVEELMFQMIDYMEMHHFNFMPYFEDIARMDEQRNIFSNPTYDINTMVDKMKGIRNRVLEKNKRLND